MLNSNLVLFIHPFVSFALPREDVEVGSGFTTIVVWFQSHLDSAVLHVPVILCILGVVTVLTTISLLVDNCFSNTNIVIIEPEGLLHDTDQVLDSLVLLVVHEVIRLVLVHNSTMHLLIELVIVNLSL